MRQYYLSERPKHLRATFRTELLALSYYPEDWDSFLQARFLIENEWSRFKKGVPSEYKPTPLVYSIMRAVSKSEAQRITCGLVAVALLGLKNAGERVSIRRAANVVSEFGHTIKGVPVGFRLENGITTTFRPISCDVSTIETTFRNYRSVAHICGATVASADHLEMPEAFAETPLADACFLSTVLLFQQELAAAKNFEKWDMWHICADPPFDYKDYPPLKPDPLLMTELFRPWVEQGKPSGR